MVLSKLPDTSSRLVGEKATEYTLSLWPGLPPASSNLSKRLPLCKSHTRTLLSRLPAAKKRLSGEIATVVTPSSMVRDKMHWLFGISQTRTVRSPEPDAIKRPSDE